MGGPSEEHQAEGDSGLPSSAPAWRRGIPLLALAMVAVLFGATGGMGDNWTPVWLVASVVAAVMVFTSPFGALVAWVLVLFLRPTDFFPDLAEYRPALRLGVLTGFLLLAGKLVRKDLKLVASKHNLWILLLAVAVLLSAVSSRDRYASIYEYRDIIVKLVLFWFLALNVLTTRHRAVVFQYAIGFAVAALGAWAIYFRFKGEPIPLPGDPDYLLRELLENPEGAAKERAFLVTGLLEDPNDLALAQLMATPFLAEAWLGARGLKKWFLGALLLLPVGGILVTQSRGGLLGLAVGSFVLLRGRISSRAVSISLVGLILAAGIVLSGVSERADTQGDEGIDLSAQGRLDAWRSGINMFSHHPLTGVGFKMFNDYYLDYAVDPAEWLAGKSAHNAFVLCLAETGLLGFIPFMMLVWLSVRANQRLLRRPPPDATFSERAVMRSQLANLAAVATSAFFLSVTWHYYLYILFVQAASNEAIFLQADGDAVVDGNGQHTAQIGLDGPSGGHG